MTKLLVEINGDGVISKLAKVEEKIEELKSAIWDFHVALDLTATEEPATEENVQ